MKSRVNSSYLQKQIDSGTRQQMEKFAAEMVAKKSFELAQDMTAIILYTLHEEYGWGEIRLMRFYNSIMPLVNELRDHYEMQDAEAARFLCTVKLKDETGIDVETLDFSDKLEVEIK